MHNPTDLQTFTFEDQAVRTITDDDGTPLFCGKDVATALGYMDPVNAIKQHCKGVAIHHPLETPGGTQQFRFITEPDVYRLIVRSRLESAQRFEAWLFEEVLPAIRKHGGYLTPAKIEEALADPDTIIRLATALKEERAKTEQARLETATVRQQLAEATPKASYYDTVLCSSSLVSTTTIAKDYGMSARRLNKILAEQGVQYKQSGTWFLYQKHAEQGYTQSRTHVIDATRTAMHTYWTQKGRLFIYDLMKGLGYLPVIERESEDDAA